MYNKKSNAGMIYRTNTGKLTVGLANYDIAMLKNDSTTPNAPPYKLVLYKQNNKVLCGLFLQRTTTKVYYQGDISLGFGIMRVQIWKNEHPKNERSPAMFITAQLLSDTSSANKDQGDQRSSIVDDAFADNSYNYNSQDSYQVVYENPNQYNLDDDDEIPF